MILMTNFGDKKRGDKNCDSDGDNTKTWEYCGVTLGSCGVTQDMGLSLGDS